MGFVYTVLWILKALWNALSETTDNFLEKFANNKHFRDAPEKFTIDLCTYMYFRHFWTKSSQIINLIDIWKLLLWISLHDCFPVTFKSSNYFIAEELTNPLLNVLMHFDHLYVHVQDLWNSVIVQRTKLFVLCRFVHWACESWFGLSFE